MILADNDAGKLPVQKNIVCDKNVKQKIITLLKMKGIIV